MQDQAVASHPVYVVDLEVIIITHYPKEVDIHVQDYTSIFNPSILAART